MNDLYDADYFSRLPRESDRIRNILASIDLETEDAVCELGCGTGDVLLAVAERVKYCLGVDFAPDAIEQANIGKRRREVNNCDFICEEITTLGETEKYTNSFTKVLMMDVTEHIDDETMCDFIQTAGRILKQSGILYIHTPNRDALLEILKDRNIILKQLPGHIAVRNTGQYRNLLENNGFNVVSVKYLPHYNRLLNIIDSIMMQIPFVGRFFKSRILIKAIITESGSRE